MNTTYDNIQTNKPYKSYKKTILGKVAVYTFNSLTNTPNAILLEGKDNNSFSATVDTWNAVEDAYFRRMNRKHLETGYVVEFVRPENYDEITPEFLADASDEDLQAILKKPWMEFKKSYLNKITSEAILIRLLTIAKTEEKSESFIKNIEAKISELQGFATSEE